MTVSPRGERRAPPGPIADAVDMLEELGAGVLPHPGGDLLTHLIRTHDLLREWEAPHDVCLGGLCHAAYGTDGFPTALLALDDRERLRGTIGVSAEEIVYLYGACDRRPTYARLGVRP